MRVHSVVLALAAFVSPIASAGAEVQTSQPHKLPISSLSAMPVLERPLLSPNGRRIVARSTHSDGIRLAVLDADRPELPAKVIGIGTGEIAALRWAGNQRLLLTLLSTKTFPGGVKVPFLRLIAIDVDTGDSRLVDRKSHGIYAGDVLYTDPTGSWALVASQDNAFTYPSVKRVELASGDAAVVEKSREGVWDWYADHDGIVRAGVAYESRRWTVWYRDKAGENLRRLRGKVDKKNDSAVDRIIFGRGKSWILTNERTGRFAVYEYDVATASMGEPVFEHPEVDVDSVTYNSATASITAVEFEDDRPRTVWFDEQMEELQASLDRALPDRVNRVMGWTDDEQRALVWSGGATDPGRYYLLDLADSKMHPVVDPYPTVDPAQLAPVRPIRYRARDGLELPAYLTLPLNSEAKNLPLVILPHGGPHQRDTWHYDPLVQFLASRGYAVLQPQFRGSTGYGKAFVEQGYGEWGKKMQDDLDDGVDWLARTGQIDPRRVCIVGASYGGYAALWGAIRNPDRYRCAVSWAGVADLPGMLKYDRKLFAATRYFREWRTKVAGQASGDLASVSPIHFAERLKIPVFIGHGEKDGRVPSSQSRKMVEALKRAGADVTSVFYDESGHDFGSSADFEDWLKQLEQFLSTHNPT